MCESFYFNINGFIQLVEKSIYFFEKAQAFELLPLLYKVCLII